MKSSRNTKAKNEIQELIITSSVALSSSEIQKSLNNMCDRVTTYRVLERLLEEGIIHKIVNVDGVTKFTLPVVLLVSIFEPLFFPTSPPT